MILFQALIVGTNLCSLSIAEVSDKNSRNPATIVWVYDFLCLRLRCHLPVSLYPVQNVDYNPDWGEQHSPVEPLSQPQALCSCLIRYASLVDFQE
jgi:hypothetical protein